MAIDTETKAYFVVKKDEKLEEGSKKMLLADLVKKVVNDLLTQK